MSSISMLALLLTGFIIFALFLGAIVAGPGAFNPTQVPQTHTNTYNVSQNFTVPVFTQIPFNTTVMQNQTLANGTIVEVPITVTNVTTITTDETFTNYTLITNSTTVYVDSCTGHGCSWWIGRLAALMAVIALALFVLAFALSSFGVASMESNFLRDGYAGNNYHAVGGVSSGYAGLQVVRSPIACLLSIACSVLGLWAIFVAVLLVIDFVVGRHDHFFIASCVILGFFGFIAGIMLLFAIFRSEAAIAIQPVVAAVPVKEQVIQQQSAYAVGNPNL